MPVPFAAVVGFKRRGGVALVMASNFRYRTATPDEVRDAVQRNVAKGIAAVGGLLAGLREGMERGQVAHEARALGESVVRNIREAAGAARDEMRRKPPPPS